MRGGAARLAASAAVGGVTRGIHAGRTTRHLATAGRCAFSAFAHLARSACFAARSAVLGIRALIDAFARTVAVAGVATQCADSAAADRNTIGRGRANLATRAAIVEVAIELLTTAVARTVACSAGQPARGAFAGGA